MKRILIFLGIALSLMFIMIILFYFWASSPNLQKEQYQKLYKNPFNTTTDTDSIYSIVTYNIGYLSGMTNNLPVAKPKKLFEQNLKHIIAQFQKTKPDIIAFQEIDYDASRSYHVNQQNEIAKLGYQYVAQAINWDETYVPFPYWPYHTQFGKVISGMSILSKFPLKEHKRMVLERHQNLPFYQKAFFLDRLAQVATVTLDGKIIKIINVHLESFDKPTREHQTDFILTLFKQYAAKYPTILLGDFNSDPADKNGIIQKTLAIPSIGNAAFTHKKYHNTYSSAEPKERIDYIFYTPKSIEYVNGKVLIEFGQASDHLPVEMQFRLR